MSKVYLFQFREDEKVKSHEYDCFKSRMFLNDNELESIDVLKSDWRIDDILQAEAILLGGSGEYLISNNDIPDILNKVGESLFALRERKVPTLGVCFGSQLMCKVFGGRVEKDESRAEVGIFDIEMTEDFVKCPVMREMPNRFKAVLGHKDHLMSLPEGAISMAKSELSPNQAFMFPDDNMYSLLFHPELDADDLLFRINMYADSYSLDEGVDIHDAILRSEIAIATSFLAGFRDKVMKKRS